MNFKKFLAGTLMIFSIMPAFAFADNTKQDESKKGLSNFCANISQVETKVADQITKAEDKQSKYESDKSAKLANKQSDTDAKKAQNRATVDGKRVQKWDKMISKAKTDAQKAAVEAYKTAVKQAVDARRTAVDAAIKTYRDSLSSALKGNADAINTAVGVFKTSVNQALTKAQADCTAGVDSKTVKKAFNQSVSDARKVLTDAKKSINSTALATLKKTRDDAINAAVTAFKTATDKAHADLVVALKS